MTWCALKVYGLLKLADGLIWYRNANLVPTTFMANDMVDLRSCYLCKTL